ncbi:MAG TPA: flavin reductase family protein [Dissulfurispiraceae bacterium]|nr:flavin reductase family protein [Dissulfurispiraceae bacterium]
MKKSLGAKTIAQPVPAWVVGSYDTKGNPNIMTIAWGGICCSQPPCLTISLRKATYTYDCIKERKAYTVNIPSVSMAKEVDYVGIVSGRAVNKFDKTKLTPVRSDLVDAPYIKEFPVVIECKVLQIVEIGLHTQFIGEIVDIKAEESVLDNEMPDILKVRPLIFDTGQRAYYGVGEFIGKAFSIGKEM